MTYTIINLYGNTAYSCKTLEDVMRWWIQNNRWDDKANLPNFSNLNMNGNDTAFFGYFDKDARPELFLRPYIVVDQDNRIVDIRNIAQHEWEEVRDKPSVSPCFTRHNGAKNHMRGRARLGSLLHDSIRQHGTMTFDIDEDIAELNITLPQPKRVVSTASSDMRADLYVRRILAEENDSPICWKKSSKARKQWAKHKKGVAADSLRRLNQLKMEAENRLDRAAQTDETIFMKDSFPINGDITVQEILEGLHNGYVELVERGCGTGTVCQIGEYWFYFGGITAEELSPEEYLRDVPMEDIAREIVDTLSSFHDDEDFADEYRYYRSFLREAASEAVNTLASLA